jgi:DNA alkylation repair enzyme
VVLSVPVDPTADFGHPQADAVMLEQRRHLRVLAGVKPALVLPDHDRIPPAVRIGQLRDSDFFLRKAIGWALRDYARTDPAWVRSFAETHELSPLSRREALKHLS